MKSSHTGALGPLQRGTRALLALAIAVWLFVAFTALRFPVGKRPPTQLEFVDEAGQPIAEAFWKSADGDTYRRGCSGTEMLPVVMDGQRVWSFCHRMGSLWGGGLIAMDVDRGRARLAWPFDFRSPYVDALAVVPGPEPGSFALVYQTSFVGGAAVGVVGRDGWRMKPVGLDDEGKRRFLGAAWVDGELEIALAHSERFAVSVPRGVLEVASIRRFKDDGSFTTRVVERARLCGDGCDRIELAYRRDGAWRLFVAREPPTENRSGDQPLVVIEIAETGADRRVIELPGDLRRASEIAPPGRVIPAPRWNLTKEGRVVPLAPPPTWPSADFYVLGYRIEGSELVPVLYHDRIIERAPSEYTFAGLDGRLVRTTDHGMGITLLDPPRGLVTRLGGCSYLRTPAFVPRPAGGTMMVSKEGCVVALNKDYERVDAPSIFETARRGRFGGDLHEGPGYLVALLWALFGLPVLIAGATLGGRQRRRWPLPVAVMVWLVLLVPAVRHLDQLR